jgi:transcriptional regulator with XRE-family HTH domain
MVAEKLIKLREKAGLSQSELARMAGLSQNYISEIEGEKRKCPIETLQKICDALGITISDFFKDEIEPIAEIPPELADIGIEYMDVLKDLKDSAIKPEDLKKILQAIKGIKGTNE